MLHGPGSFKGRIPQGGEGEGGLTSSRPPAPPWSPEDADVVNGRAGLSCGHPICTHDRLHLFVPLGSIIRQTRQAAL